MKPEGVTTSLTEHDDEHSVKVEITIEHHIPGRAKILGELLIKQVQAEHYDFKD